MNRQAGSKAMTRRKNAAIQERLIPGGGIAVYEQARQAEPDHESRGHALYRVTSFISSAIRARARDQRRSAERSDMPRLSAVSGVVKPAK